MLRTSVKPAARARSAPCAAVASAARLTSGVCLALMRKRLVRDESDVERLPGADDEDRRGAIEQVAGLGDRHAGEVGPVIGEDDRSRCAGGHQRPAVSSAIGPLPPAGTSSRTVGDQRRRVPGRRLAGQEQVDVGWRRRARRGSRRARPRSPHRRSRARRRSTAPTPTPPYGCDPTVAAKWANTGAIMNAATARSSSTIANTRCRFGRREREAGDEQRRRHGRADAEPGQARADQRHRLAGGQLRPGTRRCRRRGRSCRRAADTGATCGAARRRARCR